MSDTTQQVVHGVAITVPLNKLKKSPRNARKIPHSQAAIEALAASIQAKGMLQNMVVEGEMDAAGAETGFYLVTIGEGRRLAQLMRVKAKQIKKSEPIRCILDTRNDPLEISLDENVTRSGMHPADQFDAFKLLAETQGYGAEEIAARFGVTAQTVRQRLRLGAVSPNLMQSYRDGDLTLDQLMGFAVVDDHARQEQVLSQLGWNREAGTIRRLMLESHVRANDRRVQFVGSEAYEAAAGHILRDLFTEDGGGYFEDAALLDRLTVEKLAAAAEAVRTEGWKWVETHMDFPHAHGLSRIYPEMGALDQAAAARLAEAQATYDALNEEWDGVEELPEEIDVRLGDLEAQIQALSEQPYAYRTEDIVRAGCFVVLHHDGTTRIERGLVRPDDMRIDHHADGEGDAGTADDESEAGEGEGAADEEEDAAPAKPLSDTIIRDLTTHRTLGLRLALGEQPDIALIALTHALAAETFFRGYDKGVLLTLNPDSTALGPNADGVEDTAPAAGVSHRHAYWAAQMPPDVTDLWSHIAGMVPGERLKLLAHCTSLAVDAIRQPYGHKSLVLANAGQMAQALGLDMRNHWQPTVQAYLGRITKAQIVEAVQDGVSANAAERLSGLKKPAMADAAEELLLQTRWVPMWLRTPERLSDTSTEAELQAVAE